MSEKAKALMERLKNSPVSMENGKQDANVRDLLSVCLPSFPPFSFILFYNFAATFAVHLVFCFVFQIESIILLFISTLICSFIFTG